MIVEKWMTRNVVTIDTDDSMKEAVLRLQDHGIRTLPVLNKGRLAGIVTDRDLKKASASEATTLDNHEYLHLIGKIKVEQVMTKVPITVSPYFTVDEVAEILMKNKISGAPVVDEQGALVGIITQGDLFRVVTSFTGTHMDGVQFAFQTRDIPGSIKQIADVIRRHDGRIANILTSYISVPEGMRNVYVKVYRLDRQRLGRLKSELERTAAILYIIDYEDRTRWFHESYDRTDRALTSLLEEKKWTT
ncbi:MAG: CBS domain-containing protein [Proteobacteria bacterium]|nr:CBS domain-containing protein [Pseudomonadota bacterium]